jgi:uncharacterized membrane protein
MISLRLIILALLVAAAVAGGITYFVTSPPRVEAEQRPAKPARDVIGSPAGKPARVGQDRSAEDFLRAAEAILRPLSDAQASARTNELPILGHIPLPKRRPIPR